MADQKRKTQALEKACDLKPWPLPLRIEAPHSEFGVLEGETETEAYTISRDALGHVVRLELDHVQFRPGDRRYRQTLHSRTVWTWRPRLKLYDVWHEADSLYPDKKPTVSRSRTADIGPILADAEQLLFEAAKERAALRCNADQERQEKLVRAVVVDGRTWWITLEAKGERR